MAEARNDFPQPNSIRKYTQAELIRRRVNNPVTQLAIPTPVISPFVRFTSTRVETSVPNKYKFFHLGLHGFPTKEAGGIADALGTTSNIFQLMYGGQDVVGYAFENGKRKPILSTDSLLTKDRMPAKGAHPIPGVTGITVEHLGVNNSIRTTVNWVCYNDTQLEFLRQHFLMAGGYAIIEFGNQMSNRTPMPIFDFGNDDRVKQLTDFVTKGRRLMSDVLFEPARGNYNMFIGEIVDSHINYGTDGTINCSTISYSIGEAMFGVRNTALLSRVQTEEDKKKFTNTIRDFFKEKGEFENLLNIPSRARFVVNMSAKTETEVRTNAGEQITDTILKKFAARDSGRFIPWEMFIGDVLGELFKAVRVDEVSADAALFTEINKTEPAVGNHRLLQSTDPETLVIVKSFNTKGGQQAEAPAQVDGLARFSTVRPLSNGKPRPQYFISGSGELKDEKGLLTNGIWLNVDAIKEVFQNNNTFYYSLMALLDRMNNATENYWSLDLAFDTETEQYKIYDKKCVFGDKIIPDPYTFNRSSIGELLSIDFDASFSKEMKSFILLSSTATRRTKDEEPGARGSVNYPSLWSSILNIPDLTDELEESVRERREHELKIHMETKEPVADGSAPPSVARVTTDADQTSVALTGDEEEDRERLGILARFDRSIAPYISKPTEMLVRIFEDGIINPNQINNFTAPIPTEINLSLKMQGIAGFSFFDTFLVDKLPRVYRNHGVFLINDIKHDVNRSDGWTTTVGGLFYFVNQRGTGQIEDGATDVGEVARKQGEAISSTEDRSTGIRLTPRELKILQDDNLRGQQVSPSG
ncbi:hypothetical protein LCGC14_1004100 [marine sediment metagenome]|uniref:Uncharacterized protein n=1 Tax=marine sediment metagenome TaxID=412755 RepID=A0A0F9NNL4_9ZZZZ